MLDISTRLRITEAELAIVRNEVSELVAEKNALEVQCKKHENSWKFALTQLGRTIEERNEALAQAPPRMTQIRDSRSPEVNFDVIIVCPYPIEIAFSKNSSTFVFWFGISDHVSCLQFIVVV